MNNVLRSKAFCESDAKRTYANEMSKLLEAHV